MTSNSNLFGEHASRIKNVASFISTCCWFWRLIAYHIYWKHVSVCSTRLKIGACTSKHHTIPTCVLWRIGYREYWPFRSGSYLSFQGTKMSCWPTHMFNYFHLPLHPNYIIYIIVYVHIHWHTHYTHISTPYLHCILYNTAGNISYSIRFIHSHQSPHPDSTSSLLYICSCPGVAMALALGSGSAADGVACPACAQIQRRIPLAMPWKTQGNEMKWGTPNFRATGAKWFTKRIKHVLDNVVSNSTKCVSPNNLRKSWLAFLQTGSKWRPTKRQANDHVRSHHCRSCRNTGSQWFCQRFSWVHAGFWHVRCTVNWFESRKIIGWSFQDISSVRWNTWKLAR